VSAEGARDVGDQALISDLVTQFADCDAIVNAAGNPDASLTDEPLLNASNAALVGLLARAAALTPSHPRFVHVSSAVVQGRVAVLDDAPANAGFSAYSRSKVLGEELALDVGPEQTVVYRPPSVHAADRRVSLMIARFASSTASVVAAPGSQPTPQALLSNVASAIAFLATCEQRPPRVVAHPSEGLTVASLMDFLGGRQPRRIPRWLARIGTWTLDRLGRHIPVVAANARRAEMILFGQGQADSWLTAAGWRPPQGVEGWRALGAALAVDLNRDRGGAHA
jgi:nucleoside-diphosphate-sugar epimerase